MWGLGSRNPGPSPSPSPAQGSEESGARGGELSKPVLARAPARETVGKAHNCWFLPVWSTALTRVPGSYSPGLQPAPWSCPRRTDALLLTLLTAEASHPNSCCLTHCKLSTYLLLPTTLEPHGLPLGIEGWEPRSSSDS